jgi:hypothetical protein
MNHMVEAVMQVFDLVTLGIAVHDSDDTLVILHLTVVIKDTVLPQNYCN